MKPSELHGLFENHLLQKSVRPEVIKLLRAISADLHRDRTKYAEEARTGLKRALEKLSAKRTSLDDRFIFEGAIDRPKYEELLSRLDEEQSILNIASRNRPDQRSTSLMHSTSQKTY
jgi:hypothetical protein